MSLEGDEKTGAKVILKALDSSTDTDRSRMQVWKAQLS